MRSPQFLAETVGRLLRRQKIATMPELMTALGTRVERTVFRKLSQLPYRTSYSHRGAYYTLDDVAKFDARGLWSYKSAHFSEHGTLGATATALVEVSETGYFVDELDNVLQVGTKDVLRKLAGEGGLAREVVNARYLYCSLDSERRRRQVLARQGEDTAPVLAGSAVMPHELKAAIILFFGLLDEKQRRLYAGLEALKTGRGGDGRIAELLGLDVGTVARGRRELLEHDVEVARTRRIGGGRKAVEKKTPELIARIEELMKHDIAGDPMTGLKWTRRTTAKVAAELQAAGIEIGARSMARLLKQMDFSLRVNHKKLSSNATPDRDAQFARIAEVRERFAARALPIISIDTKKKEMVGRFKNAGVAWNREPVHVNDHDFRSEAVGMAVPYGVYDLPANRGTVFVGTSHDTAEFAVDCVERWWRTEGRQRYPDASHLAILADSGGSNSATCRAWKYALQTRLCNRHGLRVTVAHYPTGASKWNPIEHRLFSQISKNWAGRPLDSYQTITNYVRTTSTSTGLRVRAHLLPKRYDKGITITDAQMASLDIERDRKLPKWNYTLRPSKR